MLAADALAYVTAVPPRDDLAVLTQAAVVARLLPALPAAPAVVALVEQGRRTRVEIPAGGTVALIVDAARRAALRIERVSGAAVLTAWWEEPRAAASDLGAPDPDLAIVRTYSPPSPVAGNRLVEVHLELRVGGPGRVGAVEVVDLVPSGLAAVEGGPRASACDDRHRITPARIEGQRVVFEVTFGGAGPEDPEAPTVPGTFCLDYLARVVTAGTYAWEPPSPARRPRPASWRRRGRRRSSCADGPRPPAAAGGRGHPASARIRRSSARIAAPSAGSA